VHTFKVKDKSVHNCFQKIVFFALGSSRFFFAMVGLFCSYVANENTPIAAAVIG
jgi:L-asparagine transporter-like permease